MPRRFVDLSIFLENDVMSDPPAFAPKIQYFNHENTFAQIEPFFPGLQKQDLPDGEGWAVEMVQLSTHNGTHLDAPYHFHSTMDKALGDKKPAIAIHEVPLEWCFQPGVKLDFRHLADGYVVTAADVEQELARIGHNLSPLEIVVINTRAGSRYGASDYVARYREFKYQETMFELFAKQFELAKVDESREGAVIQVLDIAQPPERKAKPKKAIIAIIATLASGLALLIFVFIRSALKSASQNQETQHRISALQTSWNKALGR